MVGTESRAVVRSVRELSDLRNRAALVVGGAGHVGMAAAETLLELGASADIMDRDDDRCRQGAHELAGTTGGHVIATACDLADENATRAAVRKGISELGRLDVIVHCAAYVGTTTMPGWAVSFEHQTVPAWDAALLVNLTSAFVIVQEAREALIASGHGSVIFVSSIYGLAGPDMRLYDGTSMNNPAGYGASKGGLLQLGRQLATLLAPRVRVNAISPGGIWRNQPDAFHQRYVSRTPLGRMARSEEH